MTALYWLCALVFLATAGIPFCAWRWRMRRWGLPVRVTMDPHDPQPADIAGYLAEIASRLDERPERMRVVFNGGSESKREISLDLDADGALRVAVEGNGAKRVELRGRWIADHPVPVSLRRTVLYIEPVDSNRFRVHSQVPFPIPTAVYVACSLVATVGIVCLQPILLAFALGLSTGSYATSRLSRA